MSGLLMIPVLVSKLFAQPKLQENQKGQLTVCVTGAAGQIGYAFIPLLCTGQVFGPNINIHLRMLDIADTDTFKAQQVLKGVCMEIQDCSYPLVKSVQYGSDPYQMFKDIDVAVFIGGFPRKAGMERKELLSINGKIFTEQGKALNAVASPDVHCLVVANPANTNCLLLSENAPRVPKKNFTCLTRLDMNRTLAQVANKAGCQVSDVRNVIIWGNHSSTQYPDVEQGTINGRPIKEVIPDEDYFKGPFLQKITKRGAEVIAVRGSSSVFSAANGAKDHLHEWYFGSTPGTFTSMGIYTTGRHYGIKAGLIYSFPVICKGNFEYDIVTGLPVSKYSRDMMNVSMQELEEEKNEAHQAQQQ